MAAAAVNAGQYSLLGSHSEWCRASSVNFILHRPRDLTVNKPHCRAAHRVHAHTGQSGIGWRHSVVDAAKCHCLGWASSNECHLNNTARSTQQTSTGSSQQQLVPTAQQHQATAHTALAALMSGYVNVMRSAGGFGESGMCVTSLLVSFSAGWPVMTKTTAVTTAGNQAVGNTHTRSVHSLYLGTTMQCGHRHPCPR